MSDAPESVLVTAERIINGARRDSYGPVRESFQRIADYWSIHINTVLARDGHELDTLIELSVEDVAAMMVLLKFARETGGKHDPDNLVDIGGYTGLWDMLARGVDDV